ncbi:DUF262 domain-containing protein [Aliarcobacter lanthieri]|uniref:DUF262 domain-containing protein n=1 Tax=Aliarcobacter lanthieri TaxID=1355374 RepID=UPI003AB0E979
MKWRRDKKTIKELYELYRNYKLILKPFFQRNLVWTEKAKSKFIESILLNIPISELYLNSKDGIYNIIDGQQRLSTIFQFLEDGFTLKGLEKLTHFNDKKFSNIKDEIDILNFEIHFVEIYEFEKEEIIDSYSRINTYTVNLNDQELRKAAFYDSDFLILSEDLSIIDFFEEGKFFTPRKRQRMNDIEYISELLCILFEGIQDKKLSLDSFYDRYNSLGKDTDPKSEFSCKKKEFLNVIENIIHIFQSSKFFGNSVYDGNDAPKNISKTRFKQQADFYSLFTTVLRWNRENKIDSIINDENKKNCLLNILLFTDEMVEPESDVRLFREYATKCISQGNTKNSRIWRDKFFEEIFNFCLFGEDNILTNSIKEDLYKEFNILINFNSFDYKKEVEKIDEFYTNLEEEE